LFQHSYYGPVDAYRPGRYSLWLAVFFQPQPDSLVVFNPRCVAMSLAALTSILQGVCSIQYFCAVQD
jgi:hypothetical protein